MAAFQDAELVLALWAQGLLTHADVVQWSDRLLVRNVVEPWVIELSLDGPERGMVPDGPRPRELPFQLEFGIRLELADAEDRADVRTFMHWLTEVVIGRDLDEPHVRTGYFVEHLLSYGDEDRAVAVTQALMRVERNVDGPMSRLVPWRVCTPSENVEHSDQAQ